ncbi:unnamed protein product [Urochloa humidicola]
MKRDGGGAQELGKTRGGGELLCRRRCAATTPMLLDGVELMHPACARAVHVQGCCRTRSRIPAHLLCHPTSSTPGTSLQLFSSFDSILWWPIRAMWKQPAPLQKLGSRSVAVAAKVEAGFRRPPMLDCWDVASAEERTTDGVLSGRAAEPPAAAQSWAGERVDHGRWRRVGTRRKDDEEPFQLTSGPKR